jgi:Uma2 family endonuclease
MIACGTFDENDRLELIEGALVAKITRRPPHSTGSVLCAEAIRGLPPAGWHVRIEKPVRIPARDSMPEPDVSVVRSEIRGYQNREPGPEDVALVVEISYAAVRADRLCRDVPRGGILIYWLVDIPRRLLEIHTAAAAAPIILAETEEAELVIARPIIGNIRVGDLLPRNQATPKH